MGQPSRKFNFKVKYIAPPSVVIKKEDIVASRWGDEFDEEDEVVTIPTPSIIRINIWYDFNEEPSVNHVTMSGRVYRPAEKDMVKGKEVTKKVTTKESEPTVQVEEDSVLK